MKRSLLTLLSLIASLCISWADDTLNPDYEYAEPTIVTNSEDIGSNLVNYSFVCNNVQVSVTKGARYAAYFGVNAGESITLTATKPMKAIVVNGYIKKGFSATASSGVIVYANAEEDEVTAEQVLAVTDIQATTLTISCAKQLRCMEMSIYFEANPEININTGGEELYSYYWEPEEKTTFSLRFDSLQYIDMTDNLGYPCTSLLFSSEQAELTLAVFASTCDEGTILPAGTYTIDDSYTTGTVQASPGGDEYMDYPSYLATDFEIGTDGNLLYNPYYLIGGTLSIKAVEGGAEFEVQGTTYNGSTVNAYCLYREQPLDDAVEDTTVAPRATKVLHGGHLYLRHGNKWYGINGTKEQEQIKQSR